MQLDAAHAAAKRSLKEAGDVPLLRARSLRILGMVQVWQGKSVAVETLGEAADLCRQAGLLSRYPIAIHDLGDAYRMTRQYAEARNRYTEAVRLSKGLPLGSTVVLTQFKQVICEIAEGRSRAALVELDQLVVRGAEAGLGMSAPFGALLQCWAHSINRDLASALHAYQQIGPLQAIHIDPQIPEILLDISERLVDCLISSNADMSQLKTTTAFCSDIRDTFGGSGDTRRLQQVNRLLQRLPSVPT